ncbi:MAG: N-acetylglucosaminyl-diphospho-decaprenol L-rhamnosyltransferase [Actinomycetota bacterium]|nr:N-acetylglucosaminyl-diphospho-decaprenol L-rhamnosyltransferase [Actinomycetota bacterium]
MNPQLAVVIVTYNSREVIIDLLDSLPAALEGVDAHVVVVDNGSTDGTADLVQEHGGCTVVRSENVGYAGGINRGTREFPDAEAYLILNPDLRLHPGFIRPLFRTLAEPGTGIAAPKVHKTDGSLHRSLRRESSLLRSLGLTRTRLPCFSEYISRPRSYERPRTVDWALGAVLLVSGDCNRALEGWDESFFLYGEETDFCLRARDSGWATRFCPEASCTHIGGASGQSPRTWSMLAVNEVRLYCRRHNPLASLAFLGLTVLHEVPRMLRGNPAAPTVAAALLRPARRPAEIGCSDRLLPR